MAKRVVLAYSGGLDTSVAVRWLGEELGVEVIALAADVGQGGDFDEIRRRALAAGGMLTLQKGDALETKRRLEARGVRHVFPPGTSLKDSLAVFEADLALVFNPGPDADVHRIAEFEQSLRVMMHRSHPLARHEGPIRLKDCVDFPLAMPYRDLGARQMLDGFLAHRSLKLKPVIESNNFEFLRSYLYQEQALSFQIAIGAATNDGQLISKEIGDRGFPKGHLVLASLRGRQLPVVAHAFAEHVGTAFLVP